MAVRYLTADDLKDLIRVDRSTIYRMAESGRLPALKVGRQWRFPAEEVERWLEADPLTGPGAAPHPPSALTSRAHALAVLFADLFGVMVVVTDMQGRPVTPLVNPCGFFVAAARFPSTIEQCAAEWRGLAAEYDFQPRLRPSHLGLLCARAFVRRGNHLVGMVLAGGIAPDEWPPDPTRLAEIAQASGSDPGELEIHIDEVYRPADATRESLLRGLSVLGSHLSFYQPERSPE